MWRTAVQRGAMVGTLLVMVIAMPLGQSDFRASTSATSPTGMDISTGIAIGPTSGKIFVVDTLNNRVLRFATLANLSSGAAAEAVLGQSSFICHTTASIHG